MLYILDKFYEGNVLMHIIFETNTESAHLAKLQDVKNIIKVCNTKNVNFEILGDKVEINIWLNKDAPQSPDSTYIYLKRLSSNTIKVLSTGGIVSNMSEARFVNLLEDGLVLNCRLEGNKLKSIYTNNILTDNKFKQGIAEKYESFVLKSRLLGYNVTFNYEIDGENVRITEYTGRGKKVIIPNFITSIGREAFADKEIDEIDLNHGLKYIGEMAFTYNDIKHIELPETVQFVWYDAFVGNERLVELGGNIKDTIKKLSKDTKILHNYPW